MCSHDWEVDGARLCQHLGHLLVALALRQSYAVCSTEQARGGGQSATAELCAVLSAVGSTFIASVDESLQRSMVGFPPAAPRNFMPLAQQTVIAASRCLP